VYTRTDIHRYMKHYYIKYLTKDSKCV